MKQPENHEIDLMLRDLAKNERSSKGASEAGAHLDADELNSFAEGVLRPATRAFYASHLADCTQCRRIVAQLATASGTALKKDSTRESPLTRLWNYVARFFTPVVLRYAVPAFSLLILAALGLLWMRQQREKSFIAQSNPQAVASSPGQAGGGEPALTNEEQAKETSRSSQPDSAKRAAAKSGEVSQERENKNTRKEADGAGAGSSEKAKEETKSTVATETGASPSVAGAYAPPPPPAKAQPEAPKDSPPQAQEKVAKQQPQSKTDVADQSEDEARARRDKNEAASNERAQARKAPQGFGGLRRGVDSQVSARAVAGRRFRRENNVWIDTAYSPSTPTTNITRGSEQYRALVGDEPDLRRIAEQLDGEVIVVWKGKAYRIR